MFLKDLK